MIPSFLVPEDQTNVIDIVSIHQKIQHYYHMDMEKNDIEKWLKEGQWCDDRDELRSTEEEKEEDSEEMRLWKEVDTPDEVLFDFYLVQALPLLTQYQKSLKERGKIQFAPSLKSSSLPPSLSPAVTSSSTFLNNQPQQKPQSLHGNRNFFQYPQDTNAFSVSSSSSLSTTDIVHHYLGLVQQYFPTLHDEMDILTLRKSINVVSPSSSMEKTKLKSSSSLLSSSSSSSKKNHTNVGVNSSSRSSNPSGKTLQTTNGLDTLTDITDASSLVDNTYGSYGGNKCFHPNLILSHENMYVCEKCGFTPEQSNVSTTISFKDINRVNLASKYMYDRVTHFKDCINQFQGKQNSTIDKSVYDDLIHQFLLHDLIPTNHKDLPKEIAFQKITKEHIMLFLKDCKHTKHYEDVVLIHSNLTGSQPPDVTHLENQLLHDFDQLTTLYDKKHRQQDRKNFINTQYVLYQLLKRHKFPCRKEDFNILKTIDRKFYHDDICKSLFEELDWNFNPTF